MRDVRDVVDQLLGRKESVSTGELAKALGISPNRAAIHLRRLLDTFELRRRGDGIRTRHERGPAWGWRDGEGAIAEQIEDWKHLVADHPSIVYVPLLRFGRRFTWRKQARAISELGYRIKCLFVDFRGVDHVTEAFLEELYRHTPARLIPINMSDAIRTVNRRAQLLMSNPAPDSWEDVF